MSSSRRSYVFILGAVLVLFVFRVAGQLLVAFDLVDFLPGMQEWQSGLLPYPALVVSQLAIIALFSKICRGIYLDRGVFARKRPRLGRILRWVATFYFLSMPVRYCIYMVLVPEARWFHGTIPIVFHMILAVFLFTLSRYHQDDECSGKLSDTRSWSDC